MSDEVNANSPNVSLREHSGMSRAKLEGWYVNLGQLGYLEYSTLTRCQVRVEKNGLLRWCHLTDCVVVVEEGGRATNNFVNRGTWEDANPTPDPDTNVHRYDLKEAK